METKFEGHARAQAHKQEQFGGLMLYSYDTLVAEVRYGWLKIYGLYSMTTRKHIGWFMKELGFDYQTAKKIYNDYKCLNIYTGEIRDLG